MSNVTIDTVQNVAIEYETASIGDRVLATIIDGFVIVGLVIGLILMAWILQSLFPLAFLIVLFLIPLFFYHLLCEIFLDGQSIGKKIMKTKVVAIDGTEARLSGYFLRWLLRIVEIDMFSGVPALIAVLAGGKGQRLGDMAGGTTVIKLREKTSLEDTIFEHVRDDYQPAFPEAEKLSDEDVATIKDFLDIHDRDYDWERYSQIGQRLQQVIVAKMGVQTEMQPVAFLKTVLRDYNHVHGRV